MPGALLEKTAPALEHPQKLFITNGRFPGFQTISRYQMPCPGILSSYYLTGSSLIGYFIETALNGLKASGSYHTQPSWPGMKSSCWSPGRKMQYFPSLRDNNRYN
jgi:hypothetical protein